MFVFPHDRLVYGSYRSLLAWESERYRDHLLRLAPRDRHMRFLGAIKDDFVAQHAREALVSPQSKVIGWFAGGVLRGTVELCMSETRIVEAAFSVEAPHRRRGVGTALAHRAIRASQNRGMAQVVIFTEASNIAMRRLGARFGAKFFIERCEVEGTIKLDLASAISVMSEIAEEQGNLAGPASPLLVRGLSFYRD